MHVLGSVITHHTLLLSLINILKSNFLTKISFSKVAVTVAPPYCEVAVAVLLSRVAIPTYYYLLHFLPRFYYIFAYQEPILAISNRIRILNWLYSELSSGLCGLFWLGIIRLIIYQTISTLMNISYKLFPQCPIV